MQRISIIVSMLLILSFTVPVFAQSELNISDRPDVLPDNPFYGFKRFGELLDVIVTLDPNERAIKHVKIAEERLKEIKAMTDKGDFEKISKLQTDYKKTIDDAFETTNKLPSDNRGLLVKAFVSEKLLEHEEKLGVLVSEFTKTLKVDNQIDKQKEIVLESIRDTASKKKDAYRPVIEESIDRKR